MKNLLKELILPSFWLFFFIVSSKSEDKVNKLKKADNTELKKQDGISASGATNGINKNKEATFIKAVYLSGF
jgi:uncharacterized membrane protein